MPATLANARARIDIASAVGIPACDARFVALLNEAQEYLASMGRWWGTYKRMYVCISNDCITWPAFVANVEAFRICREGIPILNLWYEMQDNVMFPEYGLEDACAQRLILDRPVSPLFSDALIDGKIRLYPSVPADVGKQVLLQGIDASTGLPIRTQSGADYIDGEYLTLASPFVTSTFTFQKPGPVAVQKPLTSGPVTAWVVDSTTSAETAIATWGPNETNPSYRRSKITNRPAASGTCCAQTSNSCTTPPTCVGVTAEAIIRMEFIPAVVDTDWLLIGNLTALKYGMLALQHRDQNDDEQGELKTQQALRLLRNEAEKYTPKRTMRLNIRPYGTAGTRRIFSGFL